MRAQLGIVASSRLKEAALDVSTTSYVSSAASTTHTVALPAGIGAGDAVLVWWRTGGTANISSNSLSWAQTTGGNAGSWLGLVSTNAASGGESSITLTLDSSAHLCAIVLRVVRAARSGGGADAASLVDSPSSTMTATGTRDRVWVSVVSGLASNYNYTAPPSGYTDWLTVGHPASGLGDFCRIAVAWRKVNSSSATENPGPFTKVANGGNGYNGLAYTVGLIAD